MNTIDSLRRMAEEGCGPYNPNDTHERCRGDWQAVLNTEALLLAASDPALYVASEEGTGARHRLQAAVLRATRDVGGAPS
jgi:hypothetical protein